MIFIKIMQKLSQFSGKVPLEHWVSRIAINTCINQIQAEKARPELREADLSEEQAAVVRNMAATSDELAPDQRFASRELVEHLMMALKPAERLVIDLLYLQQRSVAEIQKIDRLEQRAGQSARFPGPAENEEANVDHLREGERMKQADADLDRLLRSAAKAGERSAPEAPYGFETRVIALWRAGNGRTRTTSPT